MRRGIRNCFIGLIVTWALLFLYLMTQPSGDSVANTAVKQKSGSEGTKTLIVIVGHSAQYARTNMLFFKEFGMFDSADTDFIVVINGDYEFFVPEYLKNVRVFHKANKDLDFVAWSYGLSKADLDQYKYFILLNNSVRGPFLPRYVDKKSWPSYFTQYIDDQVKMVGLLVNFDIDQVPHDEYVKAGLKDYKGYHVQSMIYAFDHTFLKVNKNSVMSLDPETKGRTWAKEVSITASMLRAGYKVKILNWAQANKNKDHPNFRLGLFHPGAKERDPTRDCTRDIGYNNFLPHCFYGMDPDLFEFMFVKTHNPPDQDPAQIMKVIDRYTAMMLRTETARCPVPDSQTLSRCMAPGGWLHLDTELQCVKRQSRPFALDHQVASAFSSLGLKNVLDIGGGMGEDCATMRQKNPAVRCDVLEPSLIFHCMEKGVQQIQASAIDSRLQLKQKYDLGMLIDAVDSIQDHQQLAIFIKRHIKKYLYIQPVPSSAFVTLLGWHKVRKGENWVLLKP